tara:strand:+ start:862 stop:1116 length:255 start_codon:yes stop_codon:yes gene_type:complete
VEELEVPTEVNPVEHRMVLLVLVVQANMVVGMAEAVVLKVQTRPMLVVMEGLEEFPEGEVVEVQEHVQPALVIRELGELELGAK